MIRVDYEVRTPVAGNIEQQLLQSIPQHVRKADVVLISDYDKGVCTAAVIATAVSAAQAGGVRILADPIRPPLTTHHSPLTIYHKYRGCSALTPNRLEAELATGRQINSADEALQAAEQLRQELDLEAGIVTLDKDGMALAHRDGAKKLFPTRPRQVYDITGAGDMVLSVLGITLASIGEFHLPVASGNPRPGESLGGSPDYEAAIRLANIAGGLEVEKIGVATVTRDEILRDLLRSGPSSAKDSGNGLEKVMSREMLLHELASRRRLGQRVAFTNGCFDILHAGHVQYLQEARSQADLLVVGLNSDASVRQLKGAHRPITPVAARAQVLAGLQAVDFITIFDDATPLALIEALRPDVLVKGADYQKHEVVGADFVESYGGQIYLAPLREGFSTTGILQRLGAA
jgi:D-beta-D-heptose 7-phosphate kinase/D-beta-D-heptose 1-phosphate adenosyltransferase